MNAELLRRVGLNPRFGYKTGTPREPRCFFRFLDGKWHDLRARHDFGYEPAAVLEILEHEMKCAPLMIFACCCSVCTARPENKAALRELLAAGVPPGEVSHGYWPEHEGAENRFHQLAPRPSPFA